MSFSFLRFSLLLLWFLLAWVGPAPLWGQHTAADFFPHVLGDQKKIWVFPLQSTTWQKPQLWIVAGVSAGSFALDGSTSRSLRTREGLNGFSGAWTSRSADIALHAIPVAFLAAGAWSGNQEVSTFGWKSTEALVDAVVLSSVLKLATQRSRPHTDKHYAFWEGGNSFPSGHSTVAWALAATAASHFRERKWVPWVVFPAAAALSFSRVSSGHHFVSDVVVGSALGFGVGYWIVR